MEGQQHDFILTAKRGYNKKNGIIYESFSWKTSLLTSIVDWESTLDVGCWMLDPERSARWLFPFGGRSPNNGGSVVSSPKDRVVGPPTPNGRTSWLKHGFVLVTNWDDPPSKKSILPTNDPYAIYKCHLAAAKNLFNRYFSYTIITPQWSSKDRISFVQTKQLLAPASICCKGSPCNSDCWNSSSSWHNDTSQPPKKTFTDRSWPVEFFVFRCMRMGNSNHILRDGKQTVALLMKPSTWDP